MSYDSAPRRTWRAKFADAFRGIYFGLYGQTSFAVHSIAALLVVVTAWMLGVDRYEWGLLVLSITAVFVAEMLNSSLECLAKAVDTQPNDYLGRALDIASAAVLLAACGAVAVGVIVFVPRLLQLLSSPAS